MPARFRVQKSAATSPDVVHAHNTFPLISLVLHRTAAQTIVLSAMLGTRLALGTYREKVTYYIALHEFCPAQVQ